MSKLIILEQVLGVSGFEYQFITDKNISKTQLLDFFNDTTKILEEIDPDINYNGELFKSYEKGPWWMLSLSFKLSGMEKALQVRTGDPNKFNIDNIVRSHDIQYRSEPQEYPGWLKEVLKDNMYYKHSMINPNLTISSTNPNYGVNKLVDALKELSYVGVSDNYDGYVFNPMEISKTEGDPNKFLTATGRPITLYKS